MYEVNPITQESGKKKGGDRFNANRELFPEFSVQCKTTCSLVPM